MAHKLPRLSKSILDLPQLITASKFEEIASFLEDRNDGIYEAANHAAKLYNDDEGKYGSSDLVEGSVGVLRVEGPTTYKKTGWEAYCGGCSYQGLLEQMEEITSNKDVKKILMSVNSGGGEAYRAFQCARDLRKKADAAGVKIYAYVDGMAASAGYALASAAHEVIMNPDAECGSIGVVVRLVNQNKRLEEEGITVKYITAGASKVPFADDGTYRPDYISDIQTKIDSLYTNFVEHVADMRNISADVVRGTDAKMFTSSDCLRLGLVDKVMEGEEFYTYLSETSETEINEDSLSPPPKEDTVNIKPKSKLITQQKDTELMSAELQVDPSEFAKLQAQMEKQSAMLAAYAAKETQLATEKLSAQLDTTPFLTECKEPLLSFFMSADVNEDHKSLMNSVIAAAQASNEATMAEAVAMGVEAQTKVDAAEAEKETIKKEFSSQLSSPTKPELSKSDLASTLKANVAAAKAKNK